MNERIKELAEQAGLNYHNWITNESNVKDSDFKYPRLEDYEKFAELIVRECVNKQMALARNYETSIEGYEPVAPEFLEGTINGLKEGCELILQHFGVEE